ncbi:MAG: PAS domain S-box protein [Endomicrobiales bacterium]
MPALTREIRSDQEALIFAEGIAGAIREGLLVLDGDLWVLSANPSFYRQFRTVPEQVEGKSLYELCDRQCDVPDLRRALENLIAGEEEFKNLKVAQHFPDTGEKVLLLNGRRVERGNGKGILVLLVIGDITVQEKERKQREEALALLNNCPDIINRFDTEERYLYVNEAMERLVGIPRGSFTGKTMWEIGAPPETAEIMRAAFRKAVETGKPETVETKFGEKIFQSLVVPETGTKGEILSFMNFARDISGIRQAEKAVRYSEELLNTFFSCAPTGMALYDDKCRYVKVNGEVAKAVGYAPEEIVGKTFREVLPEDIAEKAEETNTKVVRTGMPQTALEKRLPAGEKGRVIYVLISRFPITLPDGKMGVGAVGLDITERVLAEERLHKSEEIIQSVNSIILGTDRRGCITSINDYGLRFFGYRRDELLGKPVVGTLVPETESTGRDMAALLEDILAHPEKHLTGIHENLKKSGERVWVSWTNRALRDEKGRPAGLLEVGNDVTVLRRAEDQLRRRENEYRTLAENSPDVIERYDRRLRHLYMNPTGERLTGIPRQEFIGRTSRELGLPQETAGMWDEHIARVFETGQEDEVVFKYSTLQGVRDFQMRLIPEFANGGPVGSVLAISRDITQLKQIEDELSRATAEANQRAHEAEEGRRIMTAVMDNIPEGVIIADAPGGDIRMVSRYILEMTGLDYGELVGTPADKLAETIRFASSAAAPPMKPGGLPIVRAARYGEVVENEEWQLVRPGGESATLLINARPIRDREGGITGAIEAWRDITERKRMEDAMRRNEYELRTLVDNSPDIILRFDRDMRYAYVNPAFERLTGIPRERFAGRSNEELGMPQEQASFWEAAAKQGFESGREGSIEFSLPGFFGKRYFRGRVIPEFAKNGNVETVMILARDISEHRHAEERLRHISSHDSVTGLFNRACFEEELSRLDAERELPVSIIVAGELGNLRIVNDLFGYPEGDALLKRMSSILQSARRENDVIARRAGGEFAVLLPRTDPGTAEALARRIRKECAGASDLFIPPAVALGVAARTARHEDMRRALREAEDRMRADKSTESVKNEEQVITSLLREVERKNRGAGSHLLRLREGAEAVGKVMGLTERQTEDLKLLARLHDIGKVVLPEELLQSSRRLSIPEREALGRYPEAGYRVALSFCDLVPVADLLRAHRERWDGTGYPRGLKGAEIPLLARVFALMDAYDAITHERPYGRVFKPSEAVPELRRGAGTQFDPELAEVFAGSFEPSKQGAVP